MNMTSEELAQRCGVSRATVDRVFHNRGRVSAETRRQILETAESLGYRPNHIARSLVTGSTRSIGFVAPDLRNYFFSTLLNAAATRAQELGYVTLAALYEGGPGYECRCVSDLVDRRADGVILFSTDITAQSAKLLRDRAVPAVTVLNEAGGLPCVSVDYRMAMLDAANYAASRDYRHLIFLCPPLAFAGERNIFAISRRLEGFEEALALRKGEGVTGEVIGAPDYLEKLTALTFPREKKTAILCSSDVYALRAVKLLKTRGVRIPLDVGVMGFDGIDVLDYVEPSIATVRLPVAGIGTQAVDCLMELISGGGPKLATRLAHTIQPGQSIV